MNKIKLFKEMQIAETDPRLFSSFLEHLGRAIYTGIYEPDHPTANKDGFRMDVLELVKDLNIEYVRYPGGNFVSGYDWKDGVGPKESRPKKLDLAWRTLETNEFGINEFKDWSDLAKTKVMGAVNLGTGTIKDAAEIIEYTNHPSGTDLAELRKKHGWELPHDIDLWCLGNEMDGDWQIGHLSAEDYGKKAREAGKIMKLVDPNIETVLVGSSNPMQPTFPQWDREVLEHAFEQVDYISLHRYYWNEGNDQDFIASYVDFNKFIKTVASTVDYVKAVKRSDKDIYLSVDEWNIWYLNEVELKDWEQAPKILEDNYSVLDALAFSGLIITLLNNSDKVKIACLAQLVNVIAPIFTVPGGIAFKQTIYYPFYYFTNFGRGKVLNTFNIVNTIETKYQLQTDAVISAAVLDEENTELNIFVLNADLKNKQELSLDFSDFGDIEFMEQFILHDSLEKTNTKDNPDAVIPQFVKQVELELKPGTFTVLRYKLK